MANQFMLRTLLQTNRDERRQDMNTLVRYWNVSQAEQFENTEESLRYLIASQAEDEKDIRQLSNAFQQINVRRSSDM